VPAVITKTVKPGGGGDYVSLNTALVAEAAIRPNLVANDEILEFECYVGGPPGFASPQVPIVVDGFTTDATHYLRIYCPAGQGHAGQYDAEKFRVEVSGARAFTIGSATTKHVRLEQIQCQVTGTSSSNDGFFVSSLLTAPADIRFKNCLSKAVMVGASANGQGFRSSATAADDVTIVHSFLNCLAVGWNSQDGSSFGWNSTAHALSLEHYYNCTAIGCEVGFRDRANIRMKNCLAIGCENGFQATSGPHADSITNASTMDADARGTTPKHKVAVLMVDPLNGDFRLHNSDASVKGVGTDLSADPTFPFADDISGTARVAPWSIGCSEADGGVVPAVRWCHVGGVSPTTAKVLVHLEQADAVVNLRYGTDPTLAVFATATVASGANNNALFSLTGLKASTLYYYVVEIGGTVYTDRTGRFKTFPSSGSFQFIASGDLDTGIGALCMPTIDALDPLFFLVLGDHHYENINANDIALFRNAYDTLHHVPASFQVYQHRAVEYTWDDHDYAGDNTDSTAASKPAAQDAYRENAAHYPLPAGDPGQFPIYHSFVVGRVRFVVSDLRSARTPNGDPDTAAKTMMGATQKQWFKDELLAAKNADQLVVWICSVPWVTSVADPSDTWQGFQTERRELADFMQVNGIGNVLRLSADSHMVALDDGTNDLFTSDGKGNRHVTVHCAPINQSNSTGGGPFSHGFFNLHLNQFVLFTVVDTGGASLTVTVSGRWLGTELVAFEKSYLVELTENQELLTRLDTRPLVVDGWVRGLVEDADVDALRLGAIADGENLVPLPAGQAAVRGGSRVMLTLKDDQGAPAEIAHTCTIVPFTPIGAVAVGWSDVRDRVYAWKLTADIAFATGAEANDRTDLSAAPSTFWNNASAPPRVVAVEMFEKLFLCDATIAMSGANQRNSLLSLDKSTGAPGVVLQPAFAFGVGAAQRLRPYCLEEYNNVLFIAGYGTEDAGDEDRPEQVRHSFLGTSPDAANGFEKNAWVLLGAKGQRVTALRKGRGLLIGAKANELYRISGFGVALPGWRYQVEMIHNTHGMGVANPLALVHAEGFWYGIGKQGPFRTDGFEVQTLVGPRQRGWRSIDNLLNGFVVHHPERQLVLFGQHPEGQAPSASFPSVLWAWDLTRQVWAPNWRIFASSAATFAFFHASAIPSDTPRGPSGAPSAPNTTNITSVSYRANWTNADVTDGVETEVWERLDSSSGEWTLVAVVGKAVVLFDRLSRQAHTGYFWKVRHRKNGVFSGFTVEQKVQTLLKAPTGFSTPLGVASLCTIRTVNDNPGIVTLIVERSTNGGVDWSVWQTYFNQHKGEVSAVDPCANLHRAKVQDLNWVPSESAYSASY
jgi:alkaline phosphatase D